MRCCVPNCPNSTKRVTSVSLFSFPKSNVRNSWIEVIKLDPQSINNSTRVCIRHFTEDDIYRFATRCKLKPKRVPSIDLSCVRQVVENADEHQADTEQSQLEESRSNRPAKKIRTHFRVIKSRFYVENFMYNDKKIFYYSGIQTYKLLTALFRFVFKSEKECTTGVVHQKGNILRKKHTLTPLNEMFLTLMKLRRNFDYETLSDMFLISKSAVGRIFLTWINLLYLKLSDMNIFPHRSIILSHAPPNFLENYPNVIGSLDCTEFNIQTPSSLIRQSQCYSHYKGTNTLKGLIMINPIGAIIFVSTLYTGSISDKQIIKDSGLLALLKQKIENGQLMTGDKILTDKGFEIENILENVGIDINIPTFKITGLQFQPQDVDYIRKIAHERVHVERAIRRLKTFKILSNTMPISLSGCINQLYTVCALLTNLMPPLRK